METVYGIRVSSHDDPYVSIAEESLASLSIATIPGKFWVETFPILKHLPLWFPGSGFKHQANEWAKTTEQMREMPFEAVKLALEHGTASPSVMTALLESSPKGIESGRYPEIVANVAATSYADTTAATLTVFLLAMMMYPDVQRKAKAELHKVLGPDRLPSFSDQAELPYIEALTMELARWNSPVPISLPHATSIDDEYDGYYIPKGSIIIGNTWTLLNDAAIYPDPERFNPDRFIVDGRIDVNIPDPRDIAFGYGRRLVLGNVIRSGRA
ncbi:hypothetical protein ONZ45_g15457 [Pleurotus djamor]|nr:hypothetical protein ONZ45_g15457 [Pleurotus djamor]